MFLCILCSLSLLSAPCRRPCAGTANGGSALLWASILHLLDLENSKIVTLDITPPKWEGAGWGGVAREDPTKHPLWSKHVVFLQGGSTEAEKVEQVWGMCETGVGLQSKSGQGHCRRW